jgi:hypothetical protein
MIVNILRNKNSLSSVEFLFQKAIRKLFEKSALIGEVVPRQPLAIRRFVLVANEAVGLDRLECIISKLRTSRF